MNTVPLLAVDCPDVREMLRDADIVEFGPYHGPIQLRGERSAARDGSTSARTYVKQVRIVGDPTNPAELELARAAEQRYRRRPR